MLHTTYKSDNIKIYKSDYIKNLQQKKQLKVLELDNDKALSSVNEV